MATLEMVLAAVRDTLSRLPEINAMPDVPPEQLKSFELPAIVIYSNAGEFRWMDHSLTVGGYRTIVIDVHVARKNIKVDFAKAVQYADLVPMALFFAIHDDEQPLYKAAVKLGRGDGTTGAPIRYAWGKMGYGGQDTVGYQFMVDVTFSQEI